MMIRTKKDNRDLRRGRNIDMLKKQQKARTQTQEKMRMKKTKTKIKTRAKTIMKTRRQKTRESVCEVARDETKRQEI
jgi:hypothetical protein